MITFNIDVLVMEPALSFLQKKELAANAIKKQNSAIHIMYCTCFNECVSLQGAAGNGISPRSHQSEASRRGSLLLFCLTALLVSAC